jgi:hypothetical protein
MKLYTHVIDLKKTYDPNLEAKGQFLCIWNTFKDGRFEKKNCFDEKTPIIMLPYYRIMWNVMALFLFSLLQRIGDSCALQDKFQVIFKFQGPQ